MKDVLPFIRQHIKYPTSATTTTFTSGEQDLVSLVHSMSGFQMAAGLIDRGTAQSDLIYTLSP